MSRRAPMRVQREGNLTRMLVDLERSDYEGYYLEFANRVLWPIFHYRVNLAEYGREQWATYSRVNESFAERLAAALKPDDIVWVHDYHLIPLGAALRRLGVDNALGFFLHIPLPAPNVDSLDRQKRGRRWELSPPRTDINTTGLELSEAFSLDAIRRCTVHDNSLTPDADHRRALDVAWV
jgi:Glycosyltransferase family 20